MAGSGYQNFYKDPYHGLPHPVTGESVRWKRASSFNVLSDESALTLWKQRMVAKGIAERPDLYALASGTDLEDKKTLNQVAQEAMEAAGSKNRANLGTALHSMTQSCDENPGYVVPSTWASDIAAYKNALIGAEIRIIDTMIERKVVVPELGIAGTFDRIVDTPNGKMVLDLKTGRDLSYSWLGIGIQLALYANASHIWNEGNLADNSHYSPMIEDLNKDIALVAHLPAGEKTCTIYEVDIRQGWEDVQLSHKVRERRNLRLRGRELNKSVVTPARIDLPGMIKKCNSSDELVTLWKEYYEIWLPTHTAMASNHKAVLASRK